MISKHSEYKLSLKKKQQHQDRERHLNKLTSFLHILPFLAVVLIWKVRKLLMKKWMNLSQEKLLILKITTDGIEFGQVVEEIAKFSKDEFLFKWFKNVNNLLGFSPRCLIPNRPPLPVSKESHSIHQRMIHAASFLQ